MLCTRPPVARHQALHRLLVLIIVLLVLLVGCAGDGSSEDPVTSLPDPEASAARISTPTPGQSTATPEPTAPPAIDALLAPGPTYSAPARIFFRNRDDLWQLSSREPASAVTSRLRIGPFAPAPDGSQVAVVVYTRAAGEELQELRILSGTGETQSVALAPGSIDPRILAIAWSWDSAWLAIAWDDGALVIIPAGPAVGPTIPFGAPSPARLASRLAWAPNNAGLIWLSEGTEGHTLVVTPQTGDSIVLGYAVASPARPVRSFAWLPGRGRIAYVEGTAAATGAPSSIFTTLPDGSSRELLVSAGRFGPVAYFEDLNASPDGRRLAFSVFMPGEDGHPAYASLWVLNIDSGELEQVETPAGYRVTDLWWINIGLVWRGADLAAPTDGPPSEYAGEEPFILGIYSFDSHTSEVVFQSERDR